MIDESKRHHTGNKQTATSNKSNNTCLWHSNGTTRFKEVKEDMLHVRILVAIGSFFIIITYLLVSPLREPPPLFKVSPTTPLFSVQPGTNSVKKALLDAKISGIDTIHLDDGIHKVEVLPEAYRDKYKRDLNYLYIDSSITIVGKSRKHCIFLGGIYIQGNQKDTVVIKDLTIRGSKRVGVKTSGEGASFVFSNVWIASHYSYNMKVSNTRRNKLINCEISRSGSTGLYVENAIVTIEGKRTSIHDNGQDLSHFGIYASANSVVQIVSLTKDSISTNNYNNQNFGGHGKFKTETKVLTNRFRVQDR